MLCKTDDAKKTGFCRMSQIVFPVIPESGQYTLFRKLPVEWRTMEETL